MSDSRDKESIVPGKFWGTQPVPQSHQQAQSVEDPAGHAIDVVKDPIQDIRQTPYNLVSAYEWHTVNIDDPKELDAVYELLRDHYVTDDDGMFRFDYSRDFLKWALKPPGFLREWHVAVRSKANGTFVGFISAIPADIRVYNKEHKMVEINFLCVHSQLRKNRLAPVLIREITRRVNVTGIFQALYTAGVTLPTPVASCQYFHRSLNPKKLIEVQFSYLKKNLTIARAVKIYSLPPQPLIPGFRPMREEDSEAAWKMLMDHLAKFSIHVNFSLDEFKHWMIPRSGVVHSYVVEDPETHEITDMTSFYSLPSTILHTPKYNTLYACYAWYSVGKKHSLTEVMRDALIAAKGLGFDVFNCLEIQDNRQFLEELKFGPGDGNLQYYLYNWVCKPMEPGQVGVVLL